MRIIYTFFSFDIRVQMYRFTYIFTIIYKIHTVHYGLSNINVSINSAHYFSVWYCLEFDVVSWLMTKILILITKELKKHFIYWKYYFFFHFLTTRVGTTINDIMLIHCNIIIISNYMFAYYVPFLDLAGGRLRKVIN